MGLCGSLLNTTALGYLALYPQAQSFRWHWSKPRTHLGGCKDILCCKDPLPTSDHLPLLLERRDAWNPHFPWCHGTARWIVAQSCCCCVSEAVAAMVRGAQQVSVTRNTHFTNCWRCRWTPDECPPSSGSTKIGVLQYNWAAQSFLQENSIEKSLTHQLGLPCPSSLLVPAAGATHAPAQPCVVNASRIHHHFTLFQEAAMNKLPVFCKVTNSCFVWAENTRGKPTSTDKCCNLRQLTELLPFSWKT